MCNEKTLFFVYLCGRVWQVAGSLRTNHVKVSLAHASITFDTNPGSSVTNILAKWTDLSVHDIKFQCKLKIYIFNLPVRPIYWLESHSKQLATVYQCFERPYLFKFILSWIIRKITRLEKEWLAYLECKERKQCEQTCRSLFLSWDHTPRWDTARTVS